MKGASADRVVNRPGSEDGVNKQQNPGQPNVVVTKQNDSTIDTVSRSASDDSVTAVASAVRCFPLTQSCIEALTPPIALRPSADSVRHSVASVCGGDTDSENFEEEEEARLEPAKFWLKETATADDLPAEAREFSTLSDPQRIAQISVNIVEGWKGVLKPSDVCVNQIMAGLSNQLFQVSIREHVENRKHFRHTDALFRIYGRDVGALYDSAREVEIFTRLSKLGIVPKLLGAFEGGRIEEWISGSTLLAAHMGKRGVMDKVARILARLHSTDGNKLGADFPGGFDALSRWEHEAFRIFRACKEGDDIYVPLQRLNLRRLRKDSRLLLTQLKPEGCAATPLLQEGFSHCDIQPNNFLVTPTSLRLIDFEYAGRHFAAYDIAAYFWEMTCDYCVESPPFYAIRDELYPLEERRRFFLAIYLSERLGTNIRTGDRLVTEGLDIVERFQMLNHLVWAYWSVIRSPQAPTAQDFDMLGYARRRLDVYWRLREKLCGIKEDDSGMSSS